jgi:hypothetical protein
MQQDKTQNSVRALSGLQGVFNFEQLPSSPSTRLTQHAIMFGYRVDSQNTIFALWRRHHV